MPRFAPAQGPLSFRRIIDIPAGTCLAALDHRLRACRGQLPAGASLLRGPIQHDRDTGTSRIEVRLVRGPLRPPLPMRLTIARWSGTSTVLELIPERRVQPTLAYFRAGHCLLDALTVSLRGHGSHQRVGAGT